MITIADRFNGINSMQRLLRKQKADILRDLRHQIMDLPENPDITILSMKPRCYVMPFSALNSRDWSPEYYNFDKQYRAICREIKKKTFEQVIPFLQYIIENGCMKKIELHYFYGIHRQRVRVNIHPKVIENLKTLVRESEE